jgi:hypothetical protein
LSSALLAAYHRHVSGDLDGALAYYTSGLRAAPGERPEPWYSLAALLADRQQFPACAR